MASRKTVVLGASPKAGRYAYMAVKMLAENGYDVVPVGLRKGEIEGISIRVDKPDIRDVHTVSLYVSPERQKPLEQYIVSLKPKRVIFNPGTENPDLAERLTKLGIKCEEACTLVLLSTEQF